MLTFLDMFAQPCDFKSLQRCRPFPQQYLRLQESIERSAIYRSGAWWLTGRFNTFHPKGRKFVSRSSRHLVTLRKSFTHLLPVALQRETPTQYPCCVGSASE